MHRSAGFTLLEMVVAAAILALLITLGAPAFSGVLVSGRISASSSNLRELAMANQLYAADNGGFYCPAQEMHNLVRWHGKRLATNAPFDPTQGYLSPYLGHEGRVKMCPLFARMVNGRASFEDGTGGYGYNAAYIGGTPASPYKAIRATRVPHPQRTVMFTTTAFSKAAGLQEYAYCEPFEWVDPNGNLSGELVPSVHFRAKGKALVAWCDGHVSAEPPSKWGGTNFYGGDGQTNGIGWFGPAEANGYWNPDYEPVP